MRKIVFFLLMLFSVFVLADRTQMVYLDPFQDGKIAPIYTIEKTVEGKCYTSIADPKENAWRCFDDSGVVYDPCFSKNVDRNTLACFKSPWDQSAVELKTELPYIRVYKKQSLDHYSPWGIELSNGVKCSLSVGASTEINQERIAYVCEQGTYIIDDIHHEKNFMAALWQHGEYMDWVRVAKAWY